MSVHQLAWKSFKQDMEKLDNWTYRKIQAHETWIYDYLYDYTTFKIQCLSNRYCHENTRSISSSCYRTASGVLDKIYTEFEDWLENFRRELCIQIYRELSDRYDYLTSDQSIIETIRAKEYEFYHNGKIA
ncbi:MAG: hypothetical protein JXR78_06445 [Victivallales bacterium]|nr:hypothetical protein [Victivallales bacterium]